MEKRKILLTVLVLCFSLVCHSMLLAKGSRSEEGQGPAAVEGKGHKAEPKGPVGKGKGLSTAARNQVRNAYKFLQQGKPRQALKELEKAHRMAPDDYWVNYYSAGAYHMLKDYALARSYWKNAYDAVEDPALRSRVSTAEAYSDYLAGDPAKAKVSLQVALDLDGGNVRARELLAQFQTAAKPGQPQGGATLRLGDQKEFSGYFMVEMP